MIVLVFSLMSDFLLNFCEFAYYVLRFCILSKPSVLLAFSDSAPLKKGRFVMSLRPDGFRNLVFSLGLHWYLRWRELLITAGQGQESYLPTLPPLVPLCLGVIDIPCYCSPHGCTDVTDGVASLLLSGGESPDFALSPPLSPPPVGKGRCLITAWHKWKPRLHIWFPWLSA